ncbi:MAG: hypothetical protein KC488_08785 [Candidatus Cloacimonetes bacterium]|nr:hypothetical protein [Candidatus Cloacimonadota bacterium]
MSASPRWGRAASDEASAQVASQAPGKAVRQVQTQRGLATLVADHSQSGLEQGFRQGTPEPPGQVKGKRVLPHIGRWRKSKSQGERVFARIVVNQKMQDLEQQVMQERAFPVAQGPSRLSLPLDQDLKS